MLTFRDPIMINMEYHLLELAHLVKLAEISLQILKLLEVLLLLLEVLLVNLEAVFRP